jgi:hypothetical protein
MRVPAPVVALLIGLPALAWAGSEEDRAFLASEAEGALASPKTLSDPAAVRSLCGVLAEGLDPARDPDDPVPEAVAAARRAVYRLVIPAQGFAMRGQQLRLERPLVAFGGGVTVVLLDREGGTFGPEAEAAVQAAEAGRAKLELIFQLEGADEDLSPCFGHTKSDTLGLRAEPLRFALLDAKTGASLARLETRHHARLLKWLRPGAPVLRLDAQAQGGVDPTAVSALVDQPAARACLAPVAASPAGTGIAALSAAVDAQGVLHDVKVEISSFSDEAVVTCLVGALAQARLPKARAAGRITARFAVERE